MWFVYILECENGDLYTGVSNDVQRRFKEHQSGKGGHYTSYNRPQRVLHSECFQDRIDAEKREKQIKRWSRVKKIALANGNLSLLKKVL